MGIDVCTDDETNNVEEGHPGGFREELLGKGQRDGRDNPADLHDGPEACLDGGPHLVESARAGNEGHGDEVDAVLDGRNLEGRRLAVFLTKVRAVLTIKLLARICRILALRLLRPWKTFWSALIKT